ncbi:MAG TPA: DUF1501 domain-containing protein [Sorangium sp.]|nr:DUF1501 domain-containing protein [Sorangium sp.]
MLMDPKGNAPNSKGNVVNRYYQASDIVTAPNAPDIPFAPNFTGNTPGANYTYDASVVDPAGINYQFFNTLGQFTTVINGIDAETNGHSTGSRNAWSGRLTQGTPAFAALLAASIAGELPMSFITNGGYDYTGGYVAPTRVGDPNSLQALIQPNRINPNNEDSALYHTEETMARINKARQARVAAKQEIQNLPRLSNALSLLYTSRLGMADLKKINQFLPDDLGNGLARQASIALAAFAAWLTQCANLSTGGFDTHGNNTNGQSNRQAILLQGVLDLFSRAQAMGIREKLVVMVGSDFGRSFKINDGNGKDHWSVTSTMLISEQLPGNRVVGASTDAGLAEKISFTSFKPDAAGATLKHGHVHKWLRKWAGIEDAEAVKLFPLKAEGSIDLG